VPKHRDLDILRGLARARASHEPKQATHQQVEDREQHGAAMVPRRPLGGESVFWHPSGLGAITDRSSKPDRCPHQVPRWRRITGIDDHSRFCVLANLVLRETARPVCEALALP
jgi:hypothetical protein